MEAQPGSGNPETTPSNLRIVACPRASSCVWGISNDGVNVYQRIETTKNYLFQIAMDFGLVASQIILGFPSFTWHKQSRSCRSEIEPIIKIPKSAFLQRNGLSKRTNVGVAGRRAIFSAHSILEAPEAGKASGDWIPPTRWRR